MTSPASAGTLGPTPSAVSIDTLATTLQPRKTVLLLGAGSSVASGAPSGAELAANISKKLVGRVVSDDLAEVATILQQKIGRPELITAVRDQLLPLKPRGGLLVLPEFPWSAIYTTNYDRLIEQSYRRVKKPLAVVRSNYEWASLEEPDSTPLFKIHGCITRDTVDGHQAGMVLTEQDNSDHIRYRQAIFSRLGTDLVTKDVLVIGQSLKDTHLQNAMRAAADAKNNQGAPGRLFALIYDDDPDRALVWLSRGFTICFGSLDDFMHALASDQPVESESTTLPGDRLLVKPLLRVAAIDLDQESELSPDAVRMFNGRAATYADISAGYTFPRTIGTQLIARLEAAECRYLTITGVGGVGKTTLARQVLAHMRKGGAYCWEHVTDYPLVPHDWINVAHQLRDKEQRGYLLLDDAGGYMPQVNSLVQKLESDENDALRLVITANHAQWAPRMKEPALFRHGHAANLSVLTRDDISALVHLAANQSDIRALVDPQFRALSVQEQIRRLRERARADMYVCLKNIFASAGLDDILLQEYASLSVTQQDVYRFVAALETAGGRVHRQLVLRLLGISADEILDLLKSLEGIVDEYDIDPAQGLYGWATRHEVIAATIARYKYADQGQLLTLLEKTIDALNPGIKVELRSLREMCNSDWGIESITDDQAQIALYEKIIETAPGERGPRHSLIRKHLVLRNPDAAEQAIRSAEDAIGSDRPIARFKVRLAILRAEETPGILREDRLAIIQHAMPIALKAIQRYKDDKFAYVAYAELGVAAAQTGGQLDMLDDAIAAMAEACERILDPEMVRDLERYEKLRRQLSRDRPK